MKRIVFLAAVALMAAQGSAALAAFARTSSFTSLDQQSAPGRATASVATSYATGRASAYEYRGGVGVFASSLSTDIASRTFNSSIAEASFSQTMQIGLSSGQSFTPAAGTVFELTFAIARSGGTSTSVSGSGSFTSYASAAYTYDWSFAGQGSGGSRADIDDFDKPRAINDIPGQLGGTARVHLGDTVSLSLHAKANAATLALDQASASAVSDFEHTLRWGGITQVRAFDAQGQEIALPQGFELALIGGDGFDYSDAAGANPFLPPVPEPGEWAMMAAGLGVVGSAARRRGRESRAA